MSVFNLLDDCAKIENLVGQLYLVFMRQQFASAKLVELWRKTAYEEHNHEQQFLLARRLCKTIVTSPDIPPPQIKSIIKELTNIKVQCEEKCLTPAESIRLAIRIEQRLSEFHLDNMPLFSDESMNRLFESMMKNDNGHIEELHIALAELEAEYIDLAA